MANQIPTADNTAAEATTEGLRNHFLIAMPGLRDPHFAHSVTYVCEHGPAGAMGLVVTNPINLSLGEIFAQMQLDDAAGLADTPVLAGGPVHPERGFVLHSSESRWESTLTLSPDISLTASRDILVAMAEGRGPKDYLVALGYAGWEAGQLEEEMAANAWLTVPADKAILFHTPWEQRWAAAARPLGIDLNLISSTAGHA